MDGVVLPRGQEETVSRRGRGTGVALPARVVDEKGSVADNGVRHDVLKNMASDPEGHFRDS